MGFPEESIYIYLTKIKGAGVKYIVYDYVERGVSSDICFNGRGYYVFASDLDGINVEGSFDVTCSTCSYHIEKLEKEMRFHARKRQELKNELDVLTAKDNPLDLEIKL